MKVTEGLSAAEISGMVTGLDDHARELTGLGEREILNFSIRNEGGELLAGLHSWLWANAFHIGVLWVTPEHRSKGYGSALVTSAEKRARELGATKVQLSTWGFQAVGFYRALGYSVFGELPDYPAGHTRYFLFKQLA